MTVIVPAPATYGEIQAEANKAADEAVREAWQAAQDTASEEHCEGFCQCGNLEVAIVGKGLKSSAENYEVSGGVYVWHFEKEGGLEHGVIGVTGGAPVDYPQQAADEYKGWDYTMAELDAILGLTAMGLGRVVPLLKSTLASIELVAWARARVTGECTLTP